ncbi:uncharacterized protein LACBIDRAFT_335125 [Laccaria bicolor S238N-H82]|uniref:Predicted protein n=1 Tax=Laccaria bicolor (strain S238N-H82 / ATCC MYA-4686) TaxID=486041 RepID=B0E1F8_LACBS|nr:uncharacterized protein LACBIDRAFT_335125 [Laccaria bicolor S238N-H82]EDQ99321.1 predicted protein [Laccaria bicolor S238N-H82]|eukprot:XP_001890041.1 predicted protein [Laccaria bicolor S238N-H82]
MCRAWVVAGVVSVVVRTEERGGGAYVPLAHDVATSWVLSLVLGPSFHAGGVVVVSVGVVCIVSMGMGVGIVRRDNMACPQSIFAFLVHWTGTGLRKVAGSPVGVQWTGLDWTPVDWAFCQPIWPGKRATGIHWSPLESTGVHMDYVGEDQLSARLTDPAPPAALAVRLTTPDWLTLADHLKTADPMVVDHSPYLGSAALADFSTESLHPATAPGSSSYHQAPMDEDPTDQGDDGEEDYK